MMMMVVVVVARAVVMVVVVIVVIYDGGNIPRKWWEFAYIDICDKYAQMKSLRLAMIQSMDDPRCYKAYVWGDFIHTKTIQKNEQGTNLPHQISNLEQMFP